MPNLAGNPDNDAELIRAAQAGDHNAFAALLDAHLAHLRTFVALKAPVLQLVDERGILHVLSARVNRERLGGRVNFQQPSAVWPATGSADQSGEFLSVGTLLAISPDADIRALVGDSGTAYELARAMQDYGVYVTGFGDASFMLLVGEARLNREVEDTMINQLVPLLQVVANNTPATPGGGGTPRRAQAPALPGEAP